MTALQILDAVGYLNDGFIRDLNEEAPKCKANKIVYRLATAACIAVLFLAVFSIIVRNSNQDLGITVYAFSRGEEKAQSEKLSKFGKTPLDMFYAETGEAFFVFSYAAEDPEKPIQVVTQGASQEQYPAVKRAAGISEQPGNVYVYYFPELSEKAPYSVLFYTTDTAKGKWLAVTMQITLEDERYYVTLSEIKDVEIPWKPAENRSKQPEDIPQWLSEWYEPFGAVIERFNDEIGFQVIRLDENELLSFYEFYQNKTPEEFETEERARLKEAGILE